MKKTIFSSLDKGYLTEKLGIELFDLAKLTYDNLASDGVFTDNVNDRYLAGLVFENSLQSNFFSSNKNLKSFLSALPERYLIKIKEKFDLESIKWSIQLFTFLNENFILNERFKPSKENKNHKLNTVIYFDKPSKVFKNLKEYQSVVFHKVYDYIKSTPYSRCIIQMPTGSGKTRTSMEIICEFLNEFNSSVIWLANTEELIDQAFESFKEVWEFRGKKAMTAFNHMRIKEETSFNCQGFHVNTLQGFNSKKSDALIGKLLENENGIGLVVVDEAHISIAPTYQKTISKLLKKQGKLIGLTATPGRSMSRFEQDKIDDNKELSDFYFNKLFQIDTGNIPPINFLRERGILSNAKFYSIEGGYIENCLSEAEKQKMRETKKIPNKILDQLSNDSGRNAIIIDKLEKILNSGKKVLFFATSLDHSKVISSLINLIGYPAAHVDGESGPSRAQIIKKFKEGEIMLLSNFGVLTTGFDDPKIDVVFMARPTNSIVLYSQIIGRGLRGPGIGGTDTCEVYTVNDNILDMPSNNDIYSYFDEYFINTDAI